MLGAGESGFQARSPSREPLGSLPRPKAPPAQVCTMPASLVSAVLRLQSLVPALQPALPESSQSAFSCHTQEATGEGPSGKHQPSCPLLLLSFPRESSASLPQVASFGGTVLSASRPGSRSCHITSPAQRDPLASAHIADFRGIPTSGRPAPLLHLRFLLFKILKILMGPPLCYRLTIMPFHAECAEDRETPVRWNKGSPAFSTLLVHSI